MDAKNLAYYDCAWEAPTVLETDRPTTLEERREAERERPARDGRRKLFGRR